MVRLKQVPAWLKLIPCYSIACIVVCLLYAGGYVTSIGLTISPLILLIRPVSKAIRINRLHVSETDVKVVDRRAAIFFMLLMTTTIGCEVFWSGLVIGGFKSLLVTQATVALWLDLVFAGSISVLPKGSPITQSSPFASDSSFEAPFVRKGIGQTLGWILLRYATLALLILVPAHPDLAMVVCGLAGYVEGRAARSKVDLRQTALRFPIGLRTTSLARFLSDVLWVIITSTLVSAVVKSVATGRVTLAWIVVTVVAYRLMRMVGLLGLKKNGSIDI